ncbi:MAG: ATP-binding protein, partial [bacterium]
GCGISPKDINKIFDPFFTTKEVGKGVGLGLSLSQSIINNHGGSISMKSEPNKGSIATIVMPVAE